MARRGFPPISPLSAALTLHEWTLTHGAAPRMADCSGTFSGELFWFTTYLKCFQASSWSMVLTCASAVLSTVPLPTVPPGHKRCHNKPECTAIILDEGCHVRFCRECRKRNLTRSPAYCAAFAEPAFTPGDLRRHGLARLGWWDDGEMEAL